MSDPHQIAPPVQDSYFNRLMELEYANIQTTDDLENFTQGKPYLTLNNMLANHTHPLVLKTFEMDRSQWKVPDLDDSWIVPDMFEGTHYDHSKDTTVFMEWELLAGFLAHELTRDLRGGKFDTATAPYLGSSG